MNIIDLFIRYAGICVRRAKRYKKIGNNDDFWLWIGKAQAVLEITKRLRRRKCF